LIRIRRRDVVLQAISYYTALETGVWAAVDVSAIAAVPSPGYNGRLIEKCVSAILEEDSGWNRLFAQKGLTPFDVWYEDLIATPDSICRSVCNHVGVAPAYTFDLAAVALKRLASSRAEEWKQRFCAEHQALLQTLTSASR
jgi:LPS sulfotransferase NodH